MQGRTRGFFYGIILFFITLTGFAQMPIFKRYYIADIPGLSWLANFYVPHSLHYIFASLFIAMAAYALVDLMLSGRGLAALTGMGWFKGAMGLGLVVTGGLMVIRNLPGVYFPHRFISVLDLVHLGCCMALLAASAAGFKKGWVR